MKTTRTNQVKGHFAYIIQRGQYGTLARLAANFCHQCRQQLNILTQH